MEHHVGSLVIRVADGSHGVQLVHQVHPLHLGNVVRAVFQPLQGLFRPAGELGDDLLIFAGQKVREVHRGPVRVDSRGLVFSPLRGGNPGVIDDVIYSSIHVMFSFSVVLFKSSPGPWPRPR